MLVFLQRRKVAPIQPIQPHHRDQTGVRHWMILFDRSAMSDFPLPAHGQLRPSLRRRVSFDMQPSPSDIAANGITLSPVKATRRRHRRSTTVILLSS